MGYINRIKNVHFRAGTQHSRLCRMPLARVLVCLALGALISATASLSAQRTAPTAIRRSMLQVGGGFSLASPDYTQQTFRGGSLYATFDVASHWGAEFMVHQVNTPDTNAIYERTYELGPRYVWHFRGIEPFVKASYGRGVFNYPDGAANLAYNQFNVTGGLDVRVERHLYIRGEFEAQRWLNFPPHGLTPQLVTFGAAYRF